MNSTTSRLRLVAIIVLTLVIALGATSSAAAFPQTAAGNPPRHLEPPFGPWGTVTLGGAPAAAGTQVNAVISGSTLGQTTTVTDSGQGWYAVDVPGDDPSTTAKDGGAPEDTVTFTVAGHPTCQTATWASGDSSQLDLVAKDQEFADVPLTHWAFCNISEIFQAGITTGCVPAGTPAERQYCPDAYVTRAEMAAFLVRATGLTACADCTQSFNDVPDTHWAFGWIEALYGEGITTGCVPAGTMAERQYCPDAYVSRAEMAAFLARAF